MRFLQSNKTCLIASYFLVYLFVVVFISKAANMPQAKHVFVNEERFNTISSKYKMTDDEIQASENSGDDEKTAHYAEFLGKLKEMDSAIEKSGFSSVDDFYVDYDFYLNRKIFITIDRSKGDRLEFIESIALAFIKNNKNYSVIIIPGNEVLKNGGIKEIITNNGIFVLKSN